MNILQSSLESALHQIPQKFLTQLVAKKLEGQGITLSKKEREKISRKLGEGSTEAFTLLGWKFWDRRKLQLEFTEQEKIEAEHRFSEFLNQKVPELVPSIAQDLSESVLERLKKKWSAESRRQQQERDGFASRLFGRWGGGIDGLRVLLTISRELGSEISQAARHSTTENRKNLVEVLTRCHARSCLITEEIICLLCGGFADGAMARWRTLHEVAVVALFVQAHGEGLAERYILHQNVESRRGAVEFEKCSKRLGYKPIDPAKLKALDRSCARLRARFGSDYMNAYGWAAHHLGNPKPTFADIERSVGIEHLRPHYRMASHNVHANPKGAFFKLGVLDELQILLSGPSNAGLADPGHSTAISLVQVSTTLNEIHPALDTLVALKMMLKLSDEIGESFITAHSKLNDDSKLAAIAHAGGTV